jgi:phosphoglycerate kinase
VSGPLAGIDTLGELSGRRVLVRADLNVPLEYGAVRDDSRIRATLPTLRELAGRGARVVVLAHLGRPKGEHHPELSLAPVAQRLGELFGSVRFVEDVAGPAARRAVDGLADGQLLLCENLRFEAAETSRDPAERARFADRLAQLGDAYVGEAFGAVHRCHASVVELPARLPHCAGQLVRGELAVLRRLTGEPERPYSVLLGGAKVSDKLGVIRALLSRVDRLLVGGGMCFTFLAARGGDIGSSLVQVEHLDACREFIEEAGRRGVDLLLPADVLAAPDPAHAPRTVAAGAIPPGLAGLDIGPEGAERFAVGIADSRTVFWNGPMGVYEYPLYAGGTRTVAAAVAGVASRGGLSVVGGGDSAAAIHALGMADSAFSHVSTGGGASLEYLEGRELPGLLALGA